MEAVRRLYRRCLSPKACAVLAPSRPSAQGAVLVVRADEIGDLVTTGPMLEALKAALPATHVTIVVRRECLPLAQRCPHVDEAIALNASWPRSLSVLRMRLRVLAFALTRLWPRRFSVALAPRLEWDGGTSALLCRFSGAPTRVGWSDRSREVPAGDEKATDALFTMTMDGERSGHCVEHAMQAARALGYAGPTPPLRPWVNASDLASARKALEGFADEGARIIAVAPGAGSRRRVWPAERYAAVLRALGGARPGMVAVLLGAACDSSDAERIAAAAGMPALNLAGRLSLPESQAVLMRCSLYLGSDSGPMHMAAAAGIPVVAPLCHPMNGSPASFNAPNRFGPWGVPNRLVQPTAPASGCTAECLSDAPHCILGVGVDAVAAACRELLP